MIRSSPEPERRRAEAPAREDRAKASARTREMRGAGRRRSNDRHPSGKRLTLASSLAVFARSRLAMRSDQRNRTPDFMHQKQIPASGEPLPVIGCGTYRGFDVNPTGSNTRLQDVLTALFVAGGSVIDSSPMYGRAEAVTGKLLSEATLHKKAFIATKVWTRGRDAGIAQM